MRNRLLAAVTALVMIALASITFESAHALNSAELQPQPNANKFSLSPSGYQEGFTSASVDEFTSISAGGAGRNDYINGKQYFISCKSFTIAPCDSASRPYNGSSETWGHAGIVACTSINENYCIETISVTIGGRTKALKPIQEIPVTYSPFDGDDAAGVPGSGSLATIWKDEEAGDLYASSANLGFSFDAAGKMRSRSSTTPFHLSIRRVAIKSQIQASNKNFDGAPCLLNLGKDCYVDVLHQDTSVIETQVRIPFKLSGWFYGRMMNTNLTSTNKAKYQLYRISATPVEIPVFAKNIPKSLCLENWCPDRIQIDAMLGVNWEKAFGTGYKANKTLDQWQYLEPSNSLTPWQAFVQMSQDTASDVRTAWSVSFSDSLTSITYGTNCENAAEGVNGVLTSNAMIYSSYGPTLEGGYFYYRVAGLHFMPDGKTPATGTYELQIDSKLARCIFKLSNLPISASLSVLKSDGKTTAVVGLSTERNGMLRISMQGFNFSMPLLRAKIYQGSPRATILCNSKRNKAVTKFISGTNPKCPSGFTKAPAN